MDLPSSILDSPDSLDFSLAESMYFMDIDYKEGDFVSYGWSSSSETEYDNILPETIFNDDEESIYPPLSPSDFPAMVPESILPETEYVGGMSSPFKNTTSVSKLSHQQQANIQIPVSGPGEKSMKPLPSNKKCTHIYESSREMMMILIPRYKPKSEHEYLPCYECTLEADQVISFALLIMGFGNSPML